MANIYSGNIDLTSQYADFHIKSVATNNGEIIGESQEIIYSSRQNTYQGNLNLLGKYGTIHIRSVAKYDNEIIGISPESTIVNNRIVSSITIIPSVGQAINVGQSIQFYAIVYDENLNDITGDVQWISNDISTASITQNGLLTSHKTGTVIVTCIDILSGISTTNEVTIISLSQPRLHFINKDLYIESDFESLQVGDEPTIFINGVSYSPTLLSGFTYQYILDLTTVSGKLTITSAIVNNDITIFESDASIFFSLANYQENNTSTLAGSFMAGTMIAGDTKRNIIGDTYGLCGTYLSGEMIAGDYRSKNVGLQVSSNLVTKYSKRIDISIPTSLVTKYSKLVGVKIICDILAIDKLIVFLAKVAPDIKLNAELVKNIKIKQNTAKDEIVYEVNMKSEIDIKQNISQTISLKGVC